MFNSIKISSFFPSLSTLNENLKPSEWENENVLLLEIEFGNKIKISNLSNMDSWSINRTNFTKLGSGTTLNEYVFDKLGTYEINLVENKLVAFSHSQESSCNYARLPNNVNVFPVRMTFILNEFKFLMKYIKGVKLLEFQSAY